MPYGADMTQATKTEPSASPTPFGEAKIDQNSGEFYMCNILEGGVVRFLAADYINKWGHCYVHCFVTPDAIFDYKIKTGGGTIKIGG